MTEQGAPEQDALWAEIEGFDGVAGTALVLGQRIARTVSGFRKIEMLEALYAKAPQVRLFAELWRAHFLLGEAELKAAGLLRTTVEHAAALHIPPGNAFALLAAGRMLVGRGRFDDALRLFHRARAIRPNDPIAATWEATTLATLGRHDEADALFEAIGRQFPWPCAVTRLSASFWRRLETRIDRLAALKPDAPLETVRPGGEWLAPPIEGNALPMAEGPVTLVSCDRLYFQRYATAYVRAWAAHGPRSGDNPAWRLHFHIVAPDAACRQRLAGWRTAGLPIAASAEQLPANAPAIASPGSAFEERTVYACARLCILPSVLARYQAPVLVTDLDLELSGAPEAIWRTLGDADTGLIRFSARVQPLWQEFYLALAAFRPTAGGRRFAALLAAYVGHFLERGEWVWSLDQAALYSAFGEASRSLPEWRCAALSPGLIDATDRPSNDGAVFHHHVASQTI